MRVRAGQGYTGYVRGVLGGSLTRRETFAGHDLRMFDDLRAMREEVYAREREVGLSRLLAGFTWMWAMTRG